MGLLDFFKKKEQPVEIDLFSLISRYNEYIIRFIINHQNGNHAPISAYERNNGSLEGFLFLIGDDNSYELMSDDAVKKMEERFEPKIAAGEIKSYVILFHNRGEDEANGAIVIAYHFNNGQKGKIECAYTIEGDTASYSNFGAFTMEQAQTIFNTELVAGKQYFNDVEEIVPPSITTTNGLKISKANVFNMSNTWAAVFGFTSYRQEGGGDVLRDYILEAMENRQPVYNKDGIRVGEVEFDHVVFRAVAQGTDFVTVTPAIKTNYFINVENKEIYEWENSRSLEAVIAGNGRDAFGITYYATDYAENRALYLNQKKHNVRLTGLVYVLDLHQNDDSKEIKFSEDFTGYMPNKDMEKYGCFDFIGDVEELEETTLLNDGSMKAYIMKVRLITHPDERDYFTIDMYVLPENMRFAELKKGMKVTGMFQLLGEIEK